MENFRKEFNFSLDAATASSYALPINITDYYVYTVYIVYTQTSVAPAVGNFQYRRHILTSSGIVNVAFNSGTPSTMTVILETTANGNTVIDSTFTISSGSADVKINLVAKYPISGKTFQRNLTMLKPIGVGAREIFPLQDFLYYTYNVNIIPSGAGTIYFQVSNDLVNFHTLNTLNLGIGQPVLSSATAIYKYFSIYMDVSSGTGQAQIYFLGRKA